MKMRGLTVLAVAMLAAAPAIAEDAGTAPVRVAEAAVDAGAADGVTPGTQVAPGTQVTPGTQVAAVPAAATVTEPEVPATQLIARVDLSEQKMYVYVENRLTYTWNVSTGRQGHGTPTGRWSAEWMAAKWRSRKYNNAPMPWSVFFYRGYAIHGTTDVRRLGRVASHGCVRLHPDNAKIFYRLVEAYGKQSTLVSIVR